MAIHQTPNLSSLPPVNFISPNIIPAKNSYSITGNEQCFGYMNNAPVQLYDLSEVLGSLITNNTGNLYNVLIIKYDGTNYTLLNEGVTSSSLITYLNNNGPVWAYLIDSSRPSVACKATLVTPDHINDTDVEIQLKGNMYLSGSSIIIRELIS